MRKWWTGVALAIVLLLSPHEAEAHKHTAGVYAAGGYLNRSDLFGGALGVEKLFCTGHPFADATRCARRFGVVATGSYFHGKHEGEDLDQFSLLAGPRVSLNTKRAQPFAQLLVGKTRDSIAGETRWRWTGSVGAGLEIGLSPGDEPWILTVQFEFYRLETESMKWYPQATIGVGYRIGIH